MNGRRTRDEQTDQLLRDALQQALAPSGADDCPTPEDLATYVERSLDRDTAAAVEAHAARCGRCQEVLAAIVQTVPPAEPAPASWWPKLSAWRLRWLVPAGAVAAVALAAYLSMDRGDGVVDAPVQMAGRIGESGTVVDDRELKVPDRPAAPAAPATPASKAGREAGRQPEVSGSTADERRSSEVAQVGQVGKVGQPVQKAELADVAGAAAPAEREDVAAQAAPSAAPEVLAEAPSKRMMARVRQGQAWSEASAPDGLVRVRVGAGGAIQRSEDGGATWTDQSSGIAVDLADVALVSPRMCWAVGRLGTVLRTIDGQTWTRRPFPAEIDLVAVSAADAQNATVTTADRRQFATHDGGVTWQAVP